MVKTDEGKKGYEVGIEDEDRDRDCVVVFCFDLVFDRT